MSFWSKIRRVIGFRTARDYLLGAALFAVVWGLLERWSPDKPPHMAWLVLYLLYCSGYTIFASLKLISGAWTPARWARTTFVFCVPIAVFVAYTAASIPDFFLVFGLFIIGIGLPMIGQLRPTLWILSTVVYVLVYHALVLWLKPGYLESHILSAALSALMFAAIVYWLARISSFVQDAQENRIHSLVVTRKQKRELTLVTRELKQKDNHIARDLKFARSFQLNQLPDLSQFNSDRFAAAMHYIALDSVGGDIIDMVRFSPDRIGVFVGDVSGHGVRASMVAMMARVGFANLCKTSEDPAVVLGALNAFLCRSLANERSCYMTAIYAVLDHDRMEVHIAAGGHQPAIMLRQGRVEEVETEPALFLGIEPDQGYRTTTVKAAPGDQLLLYTDGLTEPVGQGGEQYGERVFFDFLQGRRELEPAEILAGLAVSLEHFSLESLRDDVAIVCVKMGAIPA